VVNGFVSGFGYTGSMAIASSVAHDSHHMIVVGTNQEMMASAANRLGELGGGVSLWKDGTEVARVELPIAGLMSDSKASEVAVQAQAIVSAMIDCGCTLNNAYMQHTLLALVVIPELRISDLGLVDVNRFELTEVVSLKT
jgi:adenine deaminase